MKFKIEDLDIFIKGIDALGDVDWQGLKILQGTQLKNRANTITPVDSGDLRKSAYFDGVDTFGYTMEYAPHVEYGHRTRGGGFVAGQYYVRNNIRIQEPIYTNDVKEWIKEKISF